MRDNIGIGGENSASAGRGGAGVDREQFMSQLRQDSKMSKSNAAGRASASTTA